MYTCYPRIWLALTPTSIPLPPSVTSENSDSHLGLANYHVNGIPSVVFSTRRWKPPCPDDLYPPPFLLLVPWIQPSDNRSRCSLFDHPLRPPRRRFAPPRPRCEQFRGDKGEEKLGKETRVHLWRVNDGVEIMMIMLRLLITIRRESETDVERKFEEVARLN